MNYFLDVRNIEFIKPTSKKYMNLVRKSPPVPTSAPVNNSPPQEPHENDEFEKYLDLLIGD